MKMTTTCAIALSLGLAAASQAAIVATSDITVTASGAQSANSSNSNYTHTADGSGLSATLTDANLATVTHVSGFDASTQYLTQSTTGTLDATLIYTFSSALTDKLTTIAVWNYSQTNQLNRWADSVDVSVDTGSGLTLLGTYQLSDPGSSAINSDLIDVSGFNLVGATQVTLKINQGKADNNGTDFTSGLSEVAFQTVPEPSSAALLGLGGLALILRRRK
jgi:hypothetical protein